MKASERKVTIDVLMEGPGGDLVFRPVKASPSDLRELVEASRNPVIRRNVFRAGSDKKMKVQ